MAGLQASIERRDSKELEQYLAEDFVGPDGLDREGARRMAQVLFLRHRDVGVRTGPEEVSLQILIPAFMISELRRAFEIGFLLFLPFLVIDMVVASILMSMGMMMLPPVMISLPFKLIFFVLVDGWYLVAGSLVQSFGPS